MEVGYLTSPACTSLPTDNYTSIPDFSATVFTRALTGPTPLSLAELTKVM
jgi:hypothetical protein